MRTKYEAKKEFLAQVAAALVEIEPVIKATLSDTRAALEVVHPEAVGPIINCWQSREEPLRWDWALKVCKSAAKSCFIGVALEGRVSILTLVRVSRGCLYTKLLFLEKDGAAFGKGVAMTLVDVILEAIAASFASKLIVIDKPLAKVVGYYETFGYGVVKRRGHVVTSMAKTAKIQ